MALTTKQREQILDNREDISKAIKNSLGVFVIVSDDDLMISSHETHQIVFPHELKQIIEEARYVVEADTDCYCVVDSTTLEPVFTVSSRFPDARTIAWDFCNKLNGK